MRPISSFLDRTSLSNDRFIIRPGGELFLAGPTGEIPSKMGRLAAWAANSFYLACSRIQPYDKINFSALQSDV